MCKIPVLGMPSLLPGWLSIQEQDSQHPSRPWRNQCRRQAAGL